MNKFIVAIIIILISTANSFAQLDFGGYYKNDLLHLIKKDGSSISTDVNKIRLKIGYELSPEIYFHLEPEYVNFIKTEDIPLLGTSDIDRIIFDRGYARISIPQADFVIGKQRIAWGTGYIWNPTDVFNRFAFSFAIAEEERRGVKAIRASVPLDALSGVEGVVLVGKNWEIAPKAVKGFANFANYDLSLSFVDYCDGGSQFGFDAVGELFGLGVRSEIALINNLDIDAYAQIVLGWNYTFENGVGIDMEYFHNELGKTDRSEYDWNAIFAGDIYSLASDYVYFDLNNMLDELTTIRLDLILNIVDGSNIVYPSFSRSLSDNLDMSIEMMLRNGVDGAEFTPNDTQDPTGVIGANLFFWKFRYSF